MHVARLRSIYPCSVLKSGSPSASLFGFRPDKGYSKIEAVQQGSLWYKDWHKQPWADMTKKHRQVFCDSPVLGQKSHFLTCTGLPLQFHLTACKHKYWVQVLTWATRVPQAKDHCHVPLGIILIDFGAVVGQDLRRSCWRARRRWTRQSGYRSSRRAGDFTWSFYLICWCENLLSRLIWLKCSRHLLKQLGQ